MVVANKEKIKNLIVYDAINKILIKNKILAPKLYQENYNKNFIEIEDFGNDKICISYCICIKIRILENQNPDFDLKIMKCEQNGVEIA